MPVKDESDKGVVAGEGSSSSSGSSSNDSSSSGSDSSSNDSSSSSNDDSSSDDDSSASSSPSRNGMGDKEAVASTSTINTKPPSASPSGPTIRSRSCSANSGRSRRAASASSISSLASSTKSSKSLKKVKGSTTKKVTSTTESPKRSQSASSAGGGSNHSKAVASSSSSGKKKVPVPKKEDNISSNMSKGSSNKPKKTTTTTMGANGNNNHHHGSTSKSDDKKPSTTSSKSKVVKSGTVTNTRTIKPLHSASGPKSKAPPSSSSGKAPPTSAQKKVGGGGGGNSKVKTEVTVVSQSERKVAPGMISSGAKKKPIPHKVMPSAVHNKKETPSSQSRSTNKKQEQVVVSSTKDGVRTRASSCSSAASASTASSSMDSSSSGEDEPEDSSLAESSPTKQKKKKEKVSARLPASKKMTSTATTKQLLMASSAKSNKKALLSSSVVRNLAAELLSSADDEDDQVGKTKKKMPHQRRPLTRRQKSGVKKTIPTTTIFNQSLLLAAASSSSSAAAAAAASPTNSSSPRKSSVVALASSSSDLVPLTRLPSSIISRRSTSNSSANSSENESMGGGRGSGRRRFPFASSLTTGFSASNKNKYMSTWDSDFSDDNFAQHITNSGANNFIRVPAKTSTRPRTFDFSLMDPDAFEQPRCPFPSCDSSGHLSGKYPGHNFLSCCPRYHGFEATECVENEEERSSREVERGRYRNVLSTPGKKTPKQTSETKSWLANMKQLKETETRDGLVSQYDSLLWKDSLAIAADRIEKEQNDGVTTQGIYYRYSMAVAMGRFEMKCWCESPYPEPLSQNRRLFVCEFCLKPVGSGTVLRRHCAKCVWRHPPGDEIYRKDRLSVWEVDGKKQKTYCQNLCLLAKCFLDHKTLYLDVDPFLFYVMTLADSQGCHLVGYFSKEKNSFLNYNVSCILTLPPYMRQGFGRLLIDFSYLLTRVEGKVGSPEKPLSDLGLISYRSYWKDAVLRRLCACASREINIKDLSIELGVSTADLISTLQFLGMLKYWKGKHLVLKKQDVLEEYLERVRRRGNERQIDSCCLRWRPYQPPSDEHSSSEKS